MIQSKEKELSNPLARIIQLWMDYWEIRDPRDVLGDCIEKKEWFKGVVFSTTFLETFGKALLKEHFSGKIDPDKFEDERSIERIIVFLHASGIIEQPIYCKMMEVNKFRNKLVHFEGTTEPRLDPKEAEKIIRKAIDCLGELMKKLSQDEDNKAISMNDMTFGI